MDSSARGAVIRCKMVGAPSDEVVDAELYGGHRYRGPITMDGLGSYIWSDGLSYEGDFDSGQLTGFGVYEFENGRYDGHLFRGIRHGFGTRKRRHLLRSQRVRRGR